ncbi:MAG: DUF1549 domain-containing protein, partial [Verrucomicrobiota bacterium]
RAGCNTGSCHAKSGGQNGFQLSIFSYDPKEDHRQIVSGGRGRRISPAAPGLSLLLQKATETVPHEGGHRFEVDSKSYRILHDWITQGAPFALPGEPSLERIEVNPASSRLKKQERVSLTVTAHYSDGSTRDVTGLSEYSSNDKDFAAVDEDGRVQVGKQSGEGVVIVRYMGQVDLARMVIPPDRTLPESAYTDLPIHNFIDKHLYARHRDLGLKISPACNDAEFLRRSSLDAIGKLPGVEAVRRFLNDTSPDRYDRWVDALLADSNWADYWATQWGDMLRPNTQRVGVKPVYLLDRWLRRKFQANTSYADLVRELLTVTGSTHEVGPAVLFRDKRTPADAGAFTSRMFLGVRLECAQCHHHPSEQWGQEDYFQMA